MSSALKPLAAWVVARPEDAVTKTASGLYLPDKAAEKPKTAIVVSVGKDVKEIKKGDRIVFKSYTNTDVKVDDKEYMMVEEKDVIAIVN